MYPPKKTTAEQAVRGVVESLARAGLEATALMQDPTSGQWVVRLYSMPPKKAVVHLNAYIRRYLKACGFHASPRLTNCRLWIRVLPTE
jgi:hypothetical protein